MIETLIESISNWEKEYLIRKSKWLLLLTLLKLIIILIVSWIIIYFAYLLSLKGSNEFMSIEIVLIYSSLFFSYFAIVTSLTRYFYNLTIVTHKGLYKFNIGIFSIEDMDIVDLYRIQEIKAHNDGIIQVLLNIWELHLVEQKDREKIIHNIDNPKKAANIIEKIKNKVIIKRHSIWKEKDEE